MWRPWKLIFHLECYNVPIKLHASFSWLLASGSVPLAGHCHFIRYETRTTQGVTSVEQFWTHVRINW
jgi:hypothetical protein